jgi:hypothetical protein
MSGKEASARIKINKLLEKAGWRFFPEDNRPANIRLEASISIKKQISTLWVKTSKRLPRATSTSCYSTPRDFPLSSLRPRPRIKTLS